MLYLYDLGDNFSHAEIWNHVHVFIHGPPILRAAVWFRSGTYCAYVSRLGARFTRFIRNRSPEKEERLTGSSRLGVVILLE